MASDVQQSESPVSGADPASDASYYQQYRALSVSAIVSLIFALLSPLTFFDWTMGVIPMVSIVLGVFALVRIRRFQNELSGALPARIGVTFSLLMLVGGWGWLSYDFMTEVPEGYIRAPFAELQSNAGRSELQAIANARQYDGKKIFIKGYTLPSVSGKNMKQFIIVPDRGTCCFGGDPKITDMILVTLEDPHRVDYSLFQRKLGGVFQVKGGLRQVGKDKRVIYELQADYVK
jgi:hypothetical protein